MSRYISRRNLLGGALAAGAAAASGAIAMPGIARAATASSPGSDITAGPAALLGRLLPAGTASQVTFSQLAVPGNDRFRVAGTAGAVTVAGNSGPALLAGFNWYLRYVAGCDVGWDSEQLSLPGQLPAPPTPIEKTSSVPHRLFGNDIWTDYTFPYAGWDQWEHEIDVLALHGYNEIFMTIGQEEVLHQTLQKYGYSRADALAYTPPLAHMNGGLWQAGGWPGDLPSGISEQVAQQRLALGQRIVTRMRELGITPVMPGCLGLVPFDFASRNPGANVIDRGYWFSDHQLAWLDPRTDMYQQLAADFYAIQHQLFGDSTMYAMNPFTEGGTVNLPLDQAGAGVQKALQASRPGAIWEMHAWLSNPKPALLTYLNPATTILVDFHADRYENLDDETAWPGFPYMFGPVQDFGGHTTMGANAQIWTQRYYQWLNKTGSALAGVALSPEGGHGDAAPLEFFAELPWRDSSVDMMDWFTQYGYRRYGGTDANSKAAWSAMAITAYSMGDSDGFDEAQDTIVAARPDLGASTAATWSPGYVRYDAQTFATALPSLLAVPSSLRGSSAYRYDLASVARQVLDNYARGLLPEISTAYYNADQATFSTLTQRWLDIITLMDQIAGTVDRWLLGPYLAAAQNLGANATEQANFVADAKRVITTWGDQDLSEAGLHDYCDRAWNGLLGDFYYGRWKVYFDALATTVATAAPPPSIDWFAWENKWVLNPSIKYQMTSSGNIYQLARQVHDLTTQ